MRLISLIALFVLVFSPAFAQLTVSTWSPADGSTSVPTSATLSITFSAPVDTMQKLGDDLGLISNIDTVDAVWYSADRRTVNFKARLASNRVYFVCVYWAPGDGGATIAIPQLATFTTASAYPSPGYSVTGTVSGGSSGFTPGYSLVALADGPLVSGKPNLIIGTIANAAGDFSFSGIPAGTYWPIAVRDGNGDGYLDPSDGDPIATGDSIKVVNTAISGISLTFTLMGPMSYYEALNKAATIPTSSIPADKILHMARCWDLDTTGLAPNWNFYYSSPSAHKYYNVEVGTMDLRVDTVSANDALWFSYMKPITAPATAAPPESIIVRTEAAGGRTWRTVANTGGLSFKVQAFLGYLRYTQFAGMAFDTSKIFWGVEYELGTYPRPDSFVQVRTKRFVVDYATGTILAFTSVNEQGTIEIPTVMTLDQNYPNPFNPTTTIRYTIAGVVALNGSEGPATKVRLAIYDLLGREVAVLVNGQQESGVHTATWNAHGMASGVYYYRLEAGTNSEMKKMVLVK
jgi:hypothetical protein